MSPIYGEFRSYNSSLGLRKIYSSLINYMINSIWDVRGSRPNAKFLGETVRSISIARMSVKSSAFKLVLIKILAHDTTARMSVKGSCYMFLNI